MEILLADDHALVRDGIKQLIQRQYENACIFEAATFDETKDIAQQKPNLDLVLLDLVMPGMNGMESISILRHCIPATPIIILSGTEEPSLVRRALNLGVQGYILKTSGGKVMLSAISLVFSGGVYIPPSLLQEAVSSTDTDQALKQARQLSSNAFQNLTPRQREILAQLAQGKANKEIARNLGITSATVRTHINLLFKILNVSNRTQAGRMATELELTQNP